VWAIGTGKTPSIQQVEETHAYIRGVISEQSPNLGSALRILYGGSVKAENALDIFSLPNVDGGLVGGASLRASDFLPIINCICELKI
jgi:triosephosphate isomerase (TIM)